MKRSILFVLATALVLALGTGCKRTQVFTGGSYVLTSVHQVSNTGPTGEERSELVKHGSQQFVFEADGTFVARYSGYAVNFEKPCSGDLRGTWSVEGDQLTMTRKGGRLPRGCLPERTRVYRWEKGMLDNLTLWREWADNAWIVYRYDEM